jgi:hypothetical protein
LFDFILLSFFVIYFYFCFVYIYFTFVRRISLNSRAGLEFQEFRFFPQLFFKKKNNFMFFLNNIAEKADKKKQKTFIFQKIVEKNKIPEIQGRPPALEFKEIPRK